MLTLKPESKDKLECPTKNYTVPFYLVTDKRQWELWTTSEEERKMWLAGFMYIIVSTKEVQKIMVENS